VWEINWIENPVYHVYLYSHLRIDRGELWRTLEYDLNFNVVNGENKIINLDKDHFTVLDSNF